MSVAGYPLVSEPLPDGMVTLAGWASEINRSPAAIATHWRPMPGFPSPVGELPAAGRHGGGLGQRVYRRAELEAFRAANPVTQPESRAREMTDTRLSPDTRVTLGRFATLADVSRKTVSQYRDQPGFPAPGEDGGYGLGDLTAWWASRPGKRGPSRGAATRV